MKIFSLKGSEDPPLVAQEVTQGQTFIFEGHTCLKEYAPEGRVRWVNLETGNTWDNPIGVGACLYPVKLVNYAAVEQR